MYVFRGRISVPCGRGLPRPLSQHIHTTLYSLDQTSNSCQYGSQHGLAIHLIVLACPSSTRSTKWLPGFEHDNSSQPPGNDESILFFSCNSSHECQCKIPSNNVSYRKGALTGKYLFAHRTHRYKGYEVKLPLAHRSSPNGACAEPAGPRKPSRIILLPGNSKASLHRRTGLVSYVSISHGRAVPLPDVTVGNVTTVRSLESVSASQADTCERQHVEVDFAYPYRENSEKTEVRPRAHLVVSYIVGIVTCLLHQENVCTCGFFVQESQSLGIEHITFPNLNHLCSETKVGSVSATILSQPRECSLVWRKPVVGVP
ncbi:hypothetical protein EDD17DRAFT_879286 [Pisolithus thermaeus]|nr:hypothetical protein EDD17DRAFT_879286 [Pisolithus thermaeus]